MINTDYKDRDWLKAKLDEKTPISAIARECGVTKDTIKRWIKKHKLERGTVLQRWLQGVGLDATCPSCGEIVPNANYCCDCGKPLSPPH